MMPKQKKSTFQWPYRLLSILLLIGSIAALRLTWHHETLLYAKKAASIGLCPENQTISCDLVNTSSYSELGGIPIALFAVPTYLFLLGLILLRNRWAFFRPLIIVIGACTSLYSLFLAAIAFFEIGFVCLWCLFLYLVNVATFILGFIGYRGYRHENQAEGRFFSLKSGLALSGVSFLGLFLISLFVQSQYRSHLISTAQKPTEKKDLLGKCLPQVTLKDITNGNSFILPSTQSQKPTFLVFWSSTCGHCKKEMPEISAFLKKHPDLFNLVTVTKLKSQQKAGDFDHRDYTINYAKEIDLKGPILNDPGFLSGLLEVKGTPTSFILGPNGRVEKEWQGVVPDLSDSLYRISRNLASLIPEACSENLVAPKTEMSNWILSDQNNSRIELKTLIKAPTIIVVSSPVEPSKESEFGNFMKFSEEITKQGWQYLLISQGQPSGSHALKNRYFTNDSNSSAGVYLVSSQGSLLKAYFGTLDWNNITFQEQVFAWLKNS